MNETPAFPRISAGRMQLTTACSRENTDIAQLKLAKVIIKEERARLMRLREVILNTTFPAMFPVRVLLRLSLFWGGAEKKPIHSNQALM